MRDYHEEPPPPALARYVECAWWLDSKAGIKDYSVAPDGCLDIIYDRQRGLEAVGAMTFTRRYQIAAGAQIMGVRFQPGMARLFLDLPLAALTDESIALEDLWGRRAHELRRRLDAQEPVHQAAQMLLENLKPKDAPNPIQCSIEALGCSNGGADLDVLSREANLSPRQFRRRCLEETGLSPKLLARVLRFRHATKLAARTGQRGWCAIAADCGYFDQSHLIRDFRDFTGATPHSAIASS